MNEAKSFIEILKEHVNSDQAQLPPFNRTGLAVQQEMARPDPDMQTFEKQILRDPALTSQLLKVANSSFYRGMVEVTTVRNAIVRLGLAEVSNLVTMLTQKEDIFRAGPLHQRLHGAALDPLRGLRPRRQVDRQGVPSAEQDERSLFRGPDARHRQGHFCSWPSRT
jgi:Predicted signal transduction protein